MKKIFKHSINRLLVSAAACAAMCFALAFQVSATVVDDLTETVKGGTPSMELRLGYEYSSTDDAFDPANAINLRVRLGYRTGEFRKTSAFVQLHHLENLMEEFRFPGGGDSDNDVVADPDGNRVHQAYLDFKGIPETTARLGRQEIILDDHRLIGNIDWRQNGQSFDAFSVTNKSIPDLTLFGSYVNQVNTIFLTKVDLDGLILLHAKYTGIKDQSISAFCYLLDTESEADSARDSATYGLRFAGKLEMLKYAADVALQDDYQDGEDHDGVMFNAFLSTDVGTVNLGAGYSYISGQDGADRPFDTLFSTAHKFNGWSDQFLATNGGTLRDGLQDIYLQAGTKYMGIKFLAVYHYFDTTEDNAFDDNYGDEINLLVARKFNENLSGLLKYAYYNEQNSTSGGFSNPTKDEEVFWTRLTFKF